MPPFIPPSTIREMSRLAAQYKATNLAQGLPDFPCPPELKAAAHTAIDDNINQYSYTWGDANLRKAIAAKNQHWLGLSYDPEMEVTVTCGAAEALNAAMLSLAGVGDEVIILEPYYENYTPNVLLAKATPRYVSLLPPDDNSPQWQLDEAALKAAFNERTKVIIINTPHNPTGKVFTKAELQLVADLCQQWDVVCISDEIYEHMTYANDGNKAEHVSIATLPGMRERTVVLNALSKTYSVTGWRVGWALAPAHLSERLRNIHDFLTVCAPAPFQRAGIVALNLPDSYYTELATLYDEKRLAAMDALDSVGIEYATPEGAYYMLADIRQFGFDTDRAFAEYLVQDVGVAVVPGSGFFSEANQQVGHGFVRVCYSKSLETIATAKGRLQQLTVKAV